MNSSFEFPDEVPAPFANDKTGYFDLVNPNPDSARPSILKATPPPQQDKPRTVLNVPTSFSEVNLEQELLTAFTKAKQMLTDVEHEDIPHNQKIQNLNSINTVITNIINQQEKVYNIERTKKLEDCLINTLKAFPALKDHFLAAYKLALQGK